MSGTRRKGTTSRLVTRNARSQLRQFEAISGYYICLSQQLQRQLAYLSSVKERDSTLNCSFKYLTQLSLHSLAHRHDYTHMMQQMHARKQCKSSQLNPCHEKQMICTAGILRCCIIIHRLSRFAGVCSKNLLKLDSVSRVLDHKGQ